MKQLILLATLVAALAVSSATPRSYSGYRLVHVVPRDARDVEEVRTLSSWHGVDLWNRRPAPGEESTLMVAPGASQRRVQQHLETIGVPHTINHHDVQSLIDREVEEQAAARAAKARAVDTSGVDFTHYMTYDEIQEYLSLLAKKYPDLVTLQTIGKSYEGREMTLARVSRLGGQAKKAVLVDAGIHAREWIAPATAVYLLHRLVEYADEHADLLDAMDWYILPLVNPDGYEYSRTHDRFWRKNRGAKHEGWFKWLWNLLCKNGADVNRNFGFHWMQNGASSMPCSETFAGKAAFSEVEAQNLRDFVLNSNADGRFKMYLTLHSYGQMILYPYGYDSGLAPAPDTDELISIGNEANKAMIAAGSKPYTVENSAELYPAAGGSDDWVKGVGGVAKSFTIELPGGGWHGFDLPAKDIAVTVKQAFEGLKVFGKRAKNL